MIDREPKTLIVGGGMAGLTAAAYLARENRPVMLVEKNDRMGGLVNTIEIDEFYFDTGPRAFVNSGMVKPILNDLGLKWDFFQNSISIGIEDRLFPVKSLASLEDYQRILIDLYPADRLEVEKIISKIRRLSDYTRVLYRFDNPYFVDYSGNLSYIFRELLPWSIQLLYVLRKMKKFNVPMRDYLEKFTGNQSLIDILTQFFFRKTPTYFALGYFYVYLDYFYPREGTGALPKLLEKYNVERGVNVNLNTRITEVNPSRSTVTDSNGIQYSYDHLIWAADLKKLYSSLILEGLDAPVIDRIQDQAHNVLNSRGAESSFILFMAADRPPSYFQARGGEHLFFTPSRKGLGETIRDQKKALLADFNTLSRNQIWDWLDHFCRLNTYEVSIPALRDPALAPDGQTGIMISCLFDYDLIKQLEEAGLYDAFKEKMEDKIIQLFSDTIYEGIVEDILFKFSSTPLTIQEVAGSSEGAITGWSFETKIPVENQLQKIPRSASTPIPGVYKAGQWAYSPSGVPIAMLTGWHAAQNILKQPKPYPKKEG